MGLLKIYHQRELDPIILFYFDKVLQTFITDKLVNQYAAYRVSASVFKLLDNLVPSVMPLNSYLTCWTRSIGTSSMLVLLLNL